MLYHVIRVVPLPGQRLQVEFDDGVAGIIDLAGELTGPVFEPLRDETVFRQVTIDGFGAVCWPNGADLAPDALHGEIVGKLPLQSRLLHSLDRPAPPRPNG